MEAKKCNRCKGFYEVAFGGYLTILEIDKAKVMSAEKPRLDLCEPCLISWRNWLAEGEKKEEKSELKVEEPPKVKTPSKELSRDARSAGLMLS